MTTQEAIEFFVCSRNTLLWCPDNKNETQQAHDAYNLAITALREKWAKEQGCKDCWYHKSYNTNNEYPCQECFRGGKLDRWQSNQLTPEGES